MVSRITIVLIAMLLMFVTGAAAQPEADSPLLEMLARVPALPTNRGMITFADFEAIETAYAPAQRPHDWAAFQAWQDSEEDAPENLPYLLWWVVFGRFSSAESARFLMEAGNMPAALGIDYFEIDQELNYGTPPEASDQLAGDFDLDVVRAAFAARGYTQAASDDVELWCGEVGCEGGLTVNPRNRLVSNPFGGELGRIQPLLIEDNALISSPGIEAIEDHIAVAAGEARSLADAREYQAAVNAMTTDGTLLQAMFVDGEPLLRFATTSPATTLGLFSPQMTAEQRAEILRRLLEDYETLPQFTLLAIADVVTETEQQARLILIYSSREDAERAAELLPGRIAAYQSMMVRRQLTELLEERHVEDIRYEVVEDGAANRTALVIAFAAQKGTPEEIVQFNQMLLDPSGYPPVAFPGALFRTFAQMVVSADLGWLSTVPREEIEALLEE